jgi:thioredoxin reductase
MSINQLYDVVVIGASLEGISFCERLAEKTEGVKIALVSKHFNHLTKQSLENITLITQEILHSNYNHGLVILSGADSSNICCKTVVIATGSKPIKSTLKNVNIHYNLTNVKANKNGQAVVCGKDNLAVSYALKLAKKFKYVYLCSDSLSLRCDTKYITKLENTANVLHLPNCNILSCKADKEGNLTEVQLDTYSSIKCSALVMSLGRTPDNCGLSKRMVEVDEDGFIKTKAYNETTRVPNIYAIGDCTRHNSAHSTTLALNHIITRNNFKLKEEN